MAHTQSDQYYRNALDPTHGVSGLVFLVIENVSDYYAGTLGGLSLSEIREVDQTHPGSEVRCGNLRDFNLDH